MLRAHENPVSIKAGALSVGVHAVLLIGLLVSFNWKAAHPVTHVTEVELWDKLPTKPEPKPIEVKPEPKPEIKEEPRPEPKPIEEKKPEPEPKVDIELENKKKALEAAHKKQAALERLKQEAREEELREKKAEEKKQQEALKKLQQEALADEYAARDSKANAAKQAANASVVGEFTDKIKSKIRAKVNKTVCGDGNPELKFEIGLLPTGELSGSPKLLKSSGMAACDDAVERAIIASEPLPLPSDPNLFSQFRSLSLKFRPNE